MAHSSNSMHTTLGNSSDGAWYHHQTRTPGVILRLPRFNGDDWMIIEQLINDIDGALFAQDLKVVDVPPLVEKCSFGTAKTWLQKIRTEVETIKWKSKWYNTTHWGLNEKEDGVGERPKLEEILEPEEYVEVEYVPPQGNPDTPEDPQVKTTREAANQANKTLCEANAKINAPKHVRNNVRTGAAIGNLKDALEERFKKLSQTTPWEAREARDKGIKQRDQEPFATYVERREAAWLLYMHKTTKDLVKEGMDDAIYDRQIMDMKEQVAEEVLHNAHADLRRFLQETVYTDDEEKAVGEQRLEAYRTKARKWEKTEIGKKWLSKKPVTAVGLDGEEKPVAAASDKKPDQKKRGKQNQKNKKDKNKSAQQGDKGQNKPMECTYCGLRSHFRPECDIMPRDREKGWMGDKCKNYPILSRREKLRREEEKKKKEAKKEVTQINAQENSQTAEKLGNDTNNVGQGMLMPYGTQTAARMQTERSMSVGLHESSTPMLVTDSWGNQVPMTESAALMAIKRGELALHQTMPVAPPTLFSYTESQM